MVSLPANQGNKVESEQFRLTGLRCLSMLFYQLMARLKQRVTLADIGQASGYSRTAVSYALRDDPNISPSTRKHIQAVARRLGYLPDPLISKLMLRLKGERGNRSGSTIAFINAGDRPDFIRETPSLREFFHHASSRAQSHGYRCEEFWLHKPHRSFHRLAQMLEARGIEGILLSSSGYSDSTVNFPWERFATITVGYSIARPCLHRVVTNHYENTLLAIRKAREGGARRVGLLADAVMEPAMHNLHLAALLAEQQSWSASERIPPCLELAKLSSWRSSQRPDILLNGTDKPSDEIYLAGLHVRTPIISLVPNRDGYTNRGIDVGYKRLGEIAINRLADDLLHSRTGIPETPQTIMVNGQWYEPSMGG